MALAHHETVRDGIETYDVDVPFISENLDRVMSVVAAFDTIQPAGGFYRRAPDRATRGRRIVGNRMIFIFTLRLIRNRPAAIRLEP